MDRPPGGSRRRQSDLHHGQLGAGYGHWVVAGGVAARRVRNLRVSLIGVEAEHAHFEMMRQHFRDNEFDPDAHMLIEAAVTENDGPVQFVQGHSHEWWGQAILPESDYGFGDWPGGVGNFRARNFARDNCSRSGRCGFDRYGRAGRRGRGGQRLTGGAER